MSSILDKLNRKFALMENEETSAWKDPRSPDYDRQKAEDALYHTIGPLTDQAVWNDVPWSSPGEPVAGWEQGGKAPTWTPEEVVFAIAGDPNMLFRASGHPRSPGYGNKGGAPLYRLAKRVAEYQGRGTDKNFIADLYQNGMIPLVQMMHPGYDEMRGPFISYVMRTIQSAMEHGTGGTTAGGMAGGEQSQFFTDPEGRFRKRRPSDAGEGWTEHRAVGVQGLLKMTDPDQVRQAAEVVQGKYQTQRLHDKDPRNPFGPHSPKYYQLANQYADALEAEDEDAIERVQNQLRQFADEIEEAETPIRGASTGLGQAISTLDRAKGDLKEIHNQLMAMKDGDVVTIGDTEVLKVDKNNVQIRGELYNISDARTKGQPATADPPPGDGPRMLASQGVGIQSVDVPAGDDEGTAAGSIEGSGGEESWIDPESITYVLDLAINHSLADLIRSSDKYNQMAIGFGAKVKNGIAEIKGPMGPQELRYTIRSLGPLGSNYPGRDRPRERTNIPRDGTAGWGWIQEGEDPEIEPIPTGGMWHSIWKRGGYNQMGPTQIAQEMTDEVHEFVKLGIPSKRWTGKVKEGGLAVSKVSVSNQFRSGRVKLALIASIHKHQLGMDEAKLFSGSTLCESLSALDRELVVATCEAIIAKIDQALMEKSPPGWKGTVKAMKKHKDIDNPFALAWSMKKKGAEPHYKDDDSGEKKAEHVDEGMRPVTAIVLEQEEEAAAAPEEGQEEAAPAKEETTPEELSAWDAGPAAAEAVGKKARMGSAGRGIPGL